MDREIERMVELGIYRQGYEILMDCILGGKDEPTNPVLPAEFLEEVDVIVKDVQRRLNSLHNK